MISKQEAADLIFADVLGCLDRADQSKLNEFIDSNGVLPPSMGEFQNIAAMLPIILNAEKPDPQLKDKVARKLYRIKDEIRAKNSRTNFSGTADSFYKNSRENKKSSNLGEKLVESTEPEKFMVDDKNPEIPENENIVSELPENENIVSEIEEEISEQKVEEKKDEIKQEDFEPVTPTRNTFESFKSTREKVIEGHFKDEPEEKQDELPKEVKPEPKVPTREKIKTYDRVVTKDRKPYKTATTESPYYRKTSTKDRGKSFERAYKKRYSTTEYPGKKSGLNLWMVISLFVILVLVIAALYLNFASDIKNLKYTNDNLRQQVNDLSVKFSNTQEIQSLLESADVKIINLQGTGINPGGKGKIIISSTQGKGYLQLSDMPALGQNTSYQLWMQLPGGGYFSLGVFNPAGRVQYFPFKIPQSGQQNITEFLLTQESSTGASNPGNKVFLTGSLQ